MEKDIQNIYILNIIQPFKVLSTGISISYSHHDSNNYLLHSENNITVGGITSKYYSVGQY